MKQIRKMKQIRMCAVTGVLTLTCLFAVNVTECRNPKWKDLELRLQVSVKEAKTVERLATCVREEKQRNQHVDQQETVVIARTSLRNDDVKKTNLTEKEDIETVEKVAESGGEGKQNKQVDQQETVVIPREDLGNDDVKTTNLTDDSTVAPIKDVERMEAVAESVGPEKQNNESFVIPKTKSVDANSKQPKVAVDDSKLAIEGTQTVAKVTKSGGAEKQKNVSMVTSQTKHSDDDSKKPKLAEDDSELAIEAVEMADIPATSAHRTLGDSKCLFHNKINRIRRMQKQDDGSGYVAIDASCPSPFFVIRWIGHASVAACPMIEMASIPTTNVSVNTAHQDDFSRRLQQKHPTSHFCRCNVSTAPAGACKIEIVGIRCDFVQDLKNLDCNPQNNSFCLTAASANSASLVDPTLMQSLSCVHNPMCGLVHQAYNVTWRGNKDALLGAPMPDQMWVTDPQAEHPTLSLRCQEPFCFKEKKNLTKADKALCNNWEKQEDWHSCHCHTGIQHTHVLEKLERATTAMTESKLKMCSFGDSHSRFVVANGAILNSNLYIYVRFVNISQTGLKELQHIRSTGQILLELEDGTMTGAEKVGGFCAHEHRECCFSKSWDSHLTWIRGNCRVPSHQSIVAIHLHNHAASVNNSLHVTLEPDDIHGEFAEWSGTILDSHSSVDRPGGFHVPIKSNNLSVGLFNASRVELGHCPLQRPCASMDSDMAYVKKVGKDCDCFAIDVGQWMALDPYTLDRIESEMKAIVSHVQKMIADPTV